MKIKKILKIITKNLAAIITGSIIGIILSIIYLLKIWLPLNANDVGLAIIALLPVLIVLFSLIGIFFGGLAGLIIYWIIKFVKKKK